MELHPCSQCQRHVAVEETTCRFCGAALESAASRPEVRGRLSRAAVFASAALAAPACWTGNPPETTTVQQQQQPDPDRPNEEVPKEQPPKGRGGTITGVIVGSRDRAPVANVTVQLESAAGRQRATTGADGKYQFVGLPPGDYKIYLPPQHPRMMQSEFRVTIHGDDIVQYDSTIWQHDPNALPTPYGAPPVRRRLV